MASLHQTLLVQPLVKLKPLRKYDLLISPFLSGSFDLHFIVLGKVCFGGWLPLLKAELREKRDFSPLV